MDGTVGAFYNRPSGPFNVIDGQYPTKSPACQGAVSSLKSYVAAHGKADMFDDGVSAQLQKLTGNIQSACSH
jgi:hypothetical protein